MGKIGLLRLIVFVLVVFFLSGCEQRKPEAKTTASDFENMSFEEKEEIMQKLTLWERSMVNRSRQAAKEVQDRLEVIKQKAREAGLPPEYLE